MIFFLGKTLKWTAYVVLTVLFFSMPVLIDEFEDENSIGGGNELGAGSSLTAIGYSKFYFDSASVASPVESDSITVSIITRTDASPKIVHLYINGEHRAVAESNGSTVSVFPGVRLRPGRNDLVAVLVGREGQILAIRKAGVFSKGRM